MRNSSIKESLLQRDLALAIKLASDAHLGQFDKQGKAYILHPLHLMSQMLFDTELAIIAILHDVVEDSDTTIQDLIIEGFTSRVIDALRLLTHDPKDSYEKYIAGICTNIDAIRVKRKDIAHNSSLTRLKGLRPKDHERMEKYSKAFIQLGAAKHNFKESDAKY